ncbi:MAG TPA: LON peptidase substrate-binding domain-containing protein [Fimbriimonadaceae bacterium]|nr:LON peptidase substrate-binding domain-containing protein [Fimbriimonadaceae bacterium]
MSDVLEDLALFPLETVLFPYAPMQIHVFEPRYRQLMRDCMADDRPFGVVLLRSGGGDAGYEEPYMVGTAVRIVQVHTYEDGRLDVQVQGERRFRIRRIDDTRPYLVGQVEPVVELEVADTEEARNVIQRARENFKVYIEGLFARQELQVQVRFPPDPVALSFSIANFLSMENLEKQRLLELTDTVERLQGLTPALERSLMEWQTPRLRRLRTEDLREWICTN